MNRYLIKITYGLVILCMASHFIIYCSYSYKLFNYPYHWQPTEGDHLNYALQMSKGKCVYTDNNEYPMLFPQTPGLYNLLLAPFVRLFGVNLLFGRLISFLASLAIGLLIYLIVKKETKNIAIAVISSLLFYVWSPIADNLPIARMDSLFVMFSIAGTYFMDRWSNGRKYLALACILLLLAVYTKQTGVYAVLASFTYLFLKDKKLAFKWFIVFTGVGLTIFAVVNIISHGWYYNNIIVLTRAVVGYKFTYLLSMMRQYFSYFRIPMCFGIVLIFHCLYERKGSLWVIYFMAAMLLTVCTAGHTGGGYGYLTPLHTATCIIFGIGLHKTFQSISTVKHAFPFHEMLIFLLVVVLVAVPLLRSLRQMTGPTDEGLKNGNKLSTYIASSGKKVLIDRATIFALLNGKEILTETSPMGRLYKKGKWDPKILVDDIEKRRFSAIVMRDCSGLSELQCASEAIYRHYELVDEVKLQWRYGWVPYRIFKPVGQNQ